MHIDSLKYFFEVAKCKNITIAAKNLHISQSALSQQLLKIENKLNIKLFTRNNKGVNLTSEGEVLLKYSESILDIYNKMLKEIHNSSLGKNYISIEAVDTLSYTLLPNVICNLKNLYSQYAINLDTINSTESSNILNEIYDIHINYKKPHSSNELIIKTLGMDEFIVISNNKFSKDSITKNELVNLPMITNTEDTYLNSLLQETFNYELNDLNIIYNTNSYLSILSGINSSNYIAFIPKTLYSFYKDKFDIKQLSVENLNLTSNLYLYYSTEFYKTHSDFIKSLIQIIKGFLN